MLYETLPPVFGSPLLALALEGPTRAYHLVNHRLFLPIDKSYQKINGGGIIYAFWFFVIPMLLVIHCGLWGGIFFSEQLNIDMWEAIMALLAFLCRNSILSIKYAYYSDDELEGGENVGCEARSEATMILYVTSPYITASIVSCSLLRFLVTVAFSSLSLSRR